MSIINIQEQNEIIERLQKDVNEFQCCHQEYNPASGLYCTKRCLWSFDFNNNQDKRCNKDCPYYTQPTQQKHNQKCLNLILQLIHHNKEEQGVNT